MVKKTLECGFCGGEEFNVKTDTRPGVPAVAYCATFGCGWYKILST